MAVKIGCKFESEIFRPSKDVKICLKVCFIEIGLKINVVKHIETEYTGVGLERLHYICQSLFEIDYYRGPVNSKASQECPS